MTRRSLPRSCVMKELTSRPAIARSGKARRSATPFLAFWDKCLLAPLLEIHRSARYCSKASARAPNSLRSVITEARKHRRSEEHTSELQSLMSNSYAVLCLKNKNKHHTLKHKTH